MIAKETIIDSKVQKAQLTFSVVKWVWGGGAAILFAIGTTLYTVSTDSIALKHAVESAKARDDAQDRRLDDQMKILKDLYTEQVKTNVELNRMNTSVEYMAKDMKKDLDRYKERLEEYIEREKGKARPN